MFIFRIISWKCGLNPVVNAEIDIFHIVKHFSIESDSILQFPQQCGRVSFFPTVLPISLLFSFYIFVNLIGEKQNFILPLYLLIGLKIHIIFQFLSFLFFFFSWRAVHIWETSLFSEKSIPFNNSFLTSIPVLHASTHPKGVRSECPMAWGESEDINNPLTTLTFITSCLKAALRGKLWEEDRCCFLCNYSWQAGYPLPLQLLYILNRTVTNSYLVLWDLYASSYQGILQFLPRARWRPLLGCHLEKAIGVWFYLFWLPFLSSGPSISTSSRW